MAISVRMPLEHNCNRGANLHSGLVLALFGHGDGLFLTLQTASARTFHGAWDGSGFSTILCLGESIAHHENVLCLQRVAAVGSHGTRQGVRHKTFGQFGAALKAMQ